MVTLKNDFLSLDKNAGKYSNPEVININFLLSFSYFKKDIEKDSPYDVLRFSLTNGTASWKFEDNQKVEDIYELIINLIQGNKNKEEL